MPKLCVTVLVSREILICVLSDTIHACAILIKPFRADIANLRKLVKIYGNLGAQKNEFQFQAVEALIKSHARTFSRNGVARGYTPRSSYGA